MASWKRASRGTAGVGSGPEGGSLLLRTRFANDFCMHVGGGTETLPFNSVNRKRKILLSTNILKGSVSVRLLCWRPGSKNHRQNVGGTRRRPTRGGHNTNTYAHPPPPRDFIPPNFIAQYSKPSVSNHEGYLLTKFVASVSRLVALVSRLMDLVAH